MDRLMRRGERCGKKAVETRMKELVVAPPTKVKYRKWRAPLAPAMAELYVLCKSRHTLEQAHKSFTVGSHAKLDG